MTLSVLRALLSPLPLSPSLFGKRGGWRTVWIEGCQCPLQAPLFSVLFYILFYLGMLDRSLCAFFHAFQPLLPFVVLKFPICATLFLVVNGKGWIRQVFDVGVGKCRTALPTARISLLLFFFPLHSLLPSCVLFWETCFLSYVGVLFWTECRQRMEKSCLVTEGSAKWVFLPLTEENPREFQLHLGNIKHVNGREGNRLILFSCPMALRDKRYTLSHSEPVLRTDHNLFWAEAGFYEQEHWAFWLPKQSLGTSNKKFLCFFSSYYFVKMLFFWLYLVAVVVYVAHV